jgi:vancomycin permeability regulator SanA
MNILMKKLKIYFKIMVKTILVIVIIVLILALGINFYVKATIQNRIISLEDASSINADCIVVLGAAVRNGAPSPMLEDRLKKSVDLYNIKASNRILMSGDHIKKYYDEVNIMKQYAIDNGVPSENIFMDHAGISTYDSIYRVREIFKANKIVIVTQRYHLYRAIYIAKLLNLDVYGVETDPIVYAGQEYRELREIAARIKDFIKVIIKPESTYLGDTIPVNGNGDTTND